MNKIKEKLKDINNNNDKICQLENRLLVVEKNNKELLFQNKKVKDKYMQINNIYKKLRNNCFTENKSTKKRKNYKNKIDNKEKKFPKKTLGTPQAKKMRIEKEGKERKKKVCFSKKYLKLLRT